MTENFLKDRIDKRHDSSPFGHYYDRADEQQEGNKQGNIDVLCGLDIAPEVFECVSNGIHGSIIVLLA